MAFSDPFSAIPPGTPMFTTHSAHINGPGRYFLMEVKNLDSITTLSVETSSEGRIRLTQSIVLNNKEVFCEIFKTSFIPGVLTIALNYDFFRDGRVYLETNEDIEADVTAAKMSRKKESCPVKKLESETNWVEVRKRPRRIDLD